MEVNSAKRTLESTSSTSSSETNDSLEEPLKKKSKSFRVRFNHVDIYYFNREQSYVSIPSTGTSSLGMSFNHFHAEKFEIDDFLTLKRNEHLAFIESNVQMKEEFEKSQNLNDNLLFKDPNIELPINTELFCPILTHKERLKILKECSNDPLSNDDIQEINLIRKSREQCGCSCKDSCETDDCSCKLNGISCQLDKLHYPCACTIKKCKNPNGLKRFDLNSVREHYDLVLRNKQPSKQQPQVKKVGRKKKSRGRKKNTQNPIIISATIPCQEKVANDISIHLNNPHDEIIILND